MVFCKQMDFPVSSHIIRFTNIFFGNIRDGAWTLTETHKEPCPSQFWEYITMPGGVVNHIGTDVVKEVWVKRRTKNDIN
jgi:hypothetical protein